MADGILWFKFIPAAFIVGLIAMGLFLILKRHLPLSMQVKILFTIFISILVISPMALDFWIRSERHVLQKRAQVFLARPMPKLLMPDPEGYVGGYFVDTNSGPANGVFGYSRILIQRYATKGRIRWSATIQGEFACTGDNCLNGNISDNIITNEDVRQYSAESHAILAQEWEMGFWQWIEDAIEMKRTVPEFEEEDAASGFIQQICGTWTNVSSSMSVSNNGTFLAISFNHDHTNILKGTEIFYGNGFKVIPDGPPVRTNDDEKDFKVIHVDGRNLIYEVDGQTNSMSR
jgi:hypothetical protein